MNEPAVNISMYDGGVIIRAKPLSFESLDDYYDFIDKLNDNIERCFEHVESHVIEDCFTDYDYDEYDEDNRYSLTFTYEDYLDIVNNLNSEFKQKLDV